MKKFIVYAVLGRKRGVSKKGFPYDTTEICLCESDQKKYPNQFKVSMDSALAEKISVQDVVEVADEDMKFSVTEWNGSYYQNIKVKNLKVVKSAAQDRQELLDKLSEVTGSKTGKDGSGKGADSQISTDSKDNGTTDDGVSTNDDDDDDDLFGGIIID